MARHKLFVREKPLFKDVLNCQGDSLQKPCQTFSYLECHTIFVSGIDLPNIEFSIFKKLNIFKKLILYRKVIKILLLIKNNFILKN